MFIYSSRLLFWGSLRLKVIFLYKKDFIHRVIAHFVVEPWLPLDVLIGEIKYLNEYFTYIPVWEQQKLPSVACPNLQSLSNVLGHFTFVPSSSLSSPPPPHPLYNVDFFFYGGKKYWNYYWNLEKFCLWRYFVVSQGLLARIACHFKGFIINLTRITHTSYWSLKRTYNSPELNNKRTRGSPFW